ncbi:MAG: cation:proton antiporter [Candidatus Diapherotrites archaeon]
MVETVLPLTTIGVIIIIAIAFSVFVKKLRQNEVIGFILAGFLLGPIGLNFLHPNDPLIKGFAELGLFVLLFYLGIELSLKEFLAAGSTIFGLALVDMVITTGLGIGVMLLLGQSLFFSVVVGIMLFCTSTAIIGKFILDKSLLKNNAAKIALSILILQDFLGIMLLVFITAMSAQGGSPFELAIAALVFAVSAFYAVYRLSIIVERWMKKNGFGHTEITLYALGIGLVVATLADLLALSTAIGAYFAGFALSETDSGHRIKKDVVFLRDFFLVFFFVAFGTTIFFDQAVNAIVLPSLEQFALLLGIALTLGFCAIFAHSFSLRVAGGLFGLHPEDTSMAAILLSPLGEFVIIIATVTIGAGVLTGEQATLISPLAFLLIIVTLLIFQPLYNLKELHQKLFSRIPGFKVHEKKSEMKPHTPYTKKQLEDFIINMFIVLCFAWVTVLLYSELPRIGVPIIYSRQVTAFILFAFFASYPFFKALRAIKRLFKHLRA